MTGPLTTVAQGALRGRSLEGGVLFAGVPFAAPPLGALRWRAPMAPTPWVGERDATSFGDAPAQIPTPGMPISASEDCLNLNVWTPSVEGRQPVLVWIFGGGFEGGTASPPLFDGERFMQRTGCVVVAPNYRVGALGWLDLAAVGADRWHDSSNLGLRDIEAALRWVRENAAAIGGDPEAVTIGGESAGAFCVGALLAAPSSAGLFQRAVLQSGSTTRVLSQERSASITRAYLARLGAKAPEDLIDVPVEALLEAQRQVVDTDLGRRNTPGARIWAVVHDGTMIPTDPQIAVTEGAATGLAVLVGANHDEARMWQRLFAAPDFEPADQASLLAEMTCCVGDAGAAVLLAAYAARSPALGDQRAMFLTDWVYRAPANRLAQRASAAGGRVWSYLSSAAPHGAHLGAFHASELTFVFDGLDRGMGPNLPAPGHEPSLVAIRDQMMGSWGAFVRTGDPGWAPYEPGAPSTRCFGGHADVVRELPDDVADVYATASFRT